MTLYPSFFLRVLEIAGLGGMTSSKSVNVQKCGATLKHGFFVTPNQQ